MIYMLIEESRLSMKLCQDAKSLYEQKNLWESKTEISTMFSKYFMTPSSVIFFKSFRRGNFSSAIIMWVFKILFPN